MIYFIQNTENNDVKIGYSARVDKRLSQLQVANSKKLRLLFQMEGDKQTESELHRQYQSHHIRGDWFKPTVVQDFINS